MKARPLIALLILLALVTPLAACGSKTDKSPTGVVKSMVSAFEKGDSFHWKRSFCDPQLADLTLATGSSQGVTLHFKDMYYEEHQDGAMATVQVSGTITTDLEGVKMEHDLAWSIDAERKGDTWCIASITDTAQLY